MRYTVLIDGGPGAYGVVFPDLPGCAAMGDSLDEAMVNAAEALRDWVHAVSAQGGSVPEPRAPDVLRVDAEVAEALAEGSIMASVALVREAGKPVRANMSLDAGVLAAIDATADRLGITRSATVELLAHRGLPELV
jgi:predicted RNase H-like HicB family nuclease